MLREAAYSAEEPELQDLFANLLLTGSDNRTFKKAHPGFATTINQLTWHDAQVLVQVRDYKWNVPIENVLGCNDGESNVTGIVLTNLNRLGLIDWEYHGARSLSPYELSSRFAREVGSPMHVQHYSDYTSTDIVGGLRSATLQFTEDLTKQLSDIHKPIGIVATDYGVLFCKACLQSIPSLHRPDMS